MTEKTQKAGKKFVPHGKQTLDAPFFHFLLQPFLFLISPILQFIYQVRWHLSRPLQVRVLPRCFPKLGIPGLRNVVYITIGQVLLFLPLLMIFYNGIRYGIFSQNITTSGINATYAIYATFLTANKANSIISFVLGIPFERMIPFHNLSALVAFLNALFHAWVEFSKGRKEEHRRLGGPTLHSLGGDDPNLVKFLFYDDRNSTGAIALISILVLVSTSLFPFIRRLCFEFWLFIHVGAAACFIYYVFEHAEVTFILYIAAWWTLDILIRYVVMAGCRYPHKANLQLIGEDVVQVSFPKSRGFQYKAGQFVQIAFPALGVLAFHPISISSCPDDEMVTLHIKSVGNWSKGLVKLAEKHEEVTMLVEGPYGSLSMDIDDDSRFQMALLVSGGIGVTHCQSVARSLLKEREVGRNLKKMRFVWAIRDLEMIATMPPLIDSNVSFVEDTKKDIENSNSSSNKAGASGIATVPSVSDDGSVEVVAIGGERVSTNNYLQSDIYLTTKESGAPSNSFCQEGRIHFGRPDLKAIVGEVIEEAQKLGVTHVAVFGCGPKSLISDLKNECRIQSAEALCSCKGDGVTLEVHEEVFEY